MGKNNALHFTETVIRYRGKHFDLSNLCLYDSDLSVSGEGSPSRHGSKEEIRSLEPSLYPGMDDMDWSFFDLEPVDLIFERARRLERKRGSHERKQSFSSDSSYSESSESSQRIYTERSQLRSKPPCSIEAEVEEDTMVTGKCGISPAPRSVDSPLTAARKYGSTPECEETYMLDFESERVDERIRPEIEVCPGLRMPLRGADETLEAIESGCAIEVMCFCCEQRLLCVADADVVICPDCRVCSPLPDINQIECYPDSEDDDECSLDWQHRQVDRRCMLARRKGIGGVGLGLRAQDAFN